MLNIFIVIIVVSKKSLPYNKLNATKCTPIKIVSGLIYCLYITLLVSAVSISKRIIVTITKIICFLFLSHALSYSMHRFLLISTLLDDIKALFIIYANL